MDLTKAPDWVLSEMIEWNNEANERENQRVKNPGG